MVCAVVPVSDIREGLNALLRRSSRLRKGVLLTGLVLGGSAGVVWLIPGTYFADDFELFRDRAAPVIAIMGFVLAAVAVASYSESTTAGLEIELAPLKEERRRLEAAISGGREPDVFRRLELNLNQIAEYYTINKSQSRNSFRFGVGAVTAGMVLLAVAIAVYLSDESGRLTPATITAVSGVLVQFIGGSAMYLYNKSLGLLNMFYERLADLQETMLAVILTDQISDEGRKDDVRAELIRSLMARSRVGPHRPGAEPGDKIAVN